MSKGRVPGGDPQRRQGSLQMLASSSTGGSAGMAGAAAGLAMPAAAPVSAPASAPARFAPVQPGRTRAGSSFTQVFGLSTVHPASKDKARPTLILGVLRFDEGPGVTALRTQLGPRLLALPRFRSVVEVSPRNSKRVHLRELDPSDVDLGYHMRELGDKEYGPADVDALCSWCYSVDGGMDTSRPLWQMHYMPRCQGGGSALLVVINHALADGTTSVAILLDVLADPAPPTGKGGAAAAASAPVEAAPAPMAAGKAHSMTRRAKPSVGPMRKARAVASGIYKGCATGLLPADRMSKLKTPDPYKPGQHKKLAFTSAIELSKVKEIKDKFPGASVNDVCLALMTICLRLYLEEANDPIMKSNRTIRGSFPVDMRKANQDVLATQFGNQFSTCLFRFPLHYSDPVSLVLDVKKQCDVIKISPEPYVTLNLVNTLLKLPTSMQFGQLIKSFSKFTSMLSNVRGPDHKVSVCGCTVQDLRFYATAPIGLYIGVLSYAGTVTASVVLDSTCEADATAVAKHWGPAADILYKATVTDRPGELFARKPSSAPKEPPKQQPQATEREE